MSWNRKGLCGVLCVCSDTAHSNDEGNERSSLVASALATFFKQVPGYVSARSSSVLDKWPTFVAKDKKTFFSFGKNKVSVLLWQAVYWSFVKLIVTFSVSYQLNTLNSNRKPKSVNAFKIFFALNLHVKF